MINNKKVKGIVFDFNGTLFQDGDINRITWREFVKEAFGKEISDEDFMTYIYGIPNKVTLEHYAGREISDGELWEFAENGKERIYRDYITTHPERQALTPGAVGVLDRLKEEGVPITIATSSGIGNLKFFFKVFGLDRWFKFEDVIYDDWSYPGKPEPDIYLKAFGKLNLAPEECMVLEDAHSGVESARRAGAGLIIGVDPGGENRLADLEAVDSVIDDFSEFRFDWLL